MKTEDAGWLTPPSRLRILLRRPAGPCCPARAFAALAAHPKTASIWYPGRGY